MPPLLGGTLISRVHGSIGRTAAAIRPSTLGQALGEIAKQPTVAAALFDILETQKLLASDARLTLLAAGPDSRVLADLLAATSLPLKAPPKPAV